jgi:TRAP-type uncharacterized transport system substrate-binding protein
MRNIVRGTLVAFAASTAMAVVLPATTAEAETREIRWGTSAVGSSGHRALVTLAATGTGNIRISGTGGATSGA